MMIPPAVLSVGVDARNHDAVVKRPKLHINPPKYLLLLSFLRKAEAHYELHDQNQPLSPNWYVFGTLQVRVPICHPAGVLMLLMP